MVDRFKNNKGFTLIELFIVLGIILIISLLSIRAVSLENYKTNQLRNSIRYIKIQLIRYYELYRTLPTNESLFKEFMKPMEIGGKFFEDVPPNPFYTGYAPEDGWRLEFISGAYYLVPVGKEEYKEIIIEPISNLIFDININPEFFSN